MSVVCTDILRKRFRQTTVGRSAPHLADQVAAVINNSKVEGTKTHYVSQFRHYVNFCLDHGQDPLHFPLDPNLCMFWIQDKVNKHGNIKSLRSWTAMLNWISDLAKAPKRYKEDSDYKDYLKGLQKQYHEGFDQRLPFQIKHIFKYTKMLWRTKTNNSSVISYTNLLKATLANLYFFTMSRPCELLMSTSSPSRLTGILVRDYHRIYDNEFKIPMIELTINVYKNQVSRKIQKKIYFCSTQCKSQSPCVCSKCNPYNLLILLLKQRQSMVNTAVNEYNDPTTPFHKKHSLFNKIQRLRLKPSNHLFVDKEGKTITTKYLSNIAKEIVNETHILDSKRYTAYSLRIGGTTTASRRGIPHPKILKYVGWSNSRLADCAQRYMRYGPHDLCLVPFHMIHGSKEEKNPKSTIYDPWSERIDQKYFK